jgi:hypothetical protein
VQNVDPTKKKSMNPNGGLFGSERGHGEGKRDKRGELIFSFLSKMFDYTRFYKDLKLSIKTIDGFQQ